MNINPKLLEINIISFVCESSNKENYAWLKERRKCLLKRKKLLEKKSKAKKAISRKTREIILPVATLQEQVNNIFDQFAEDWPGLPKVFGKGWTYPIADFERHMKLPKLDITPRVDISESDDSYDIAVELPGMTEKDIELALSDDSLTLKGEKKTEREEKKKNYHVSERSYGSFQRTFRVPNGVDQNKVEAAYSKGVLNVSLPKTEAAKSNKRSIEVKGA